MTVYSRRFALGLLTIGLAACGRKETATGAKGRSTGLNAGETPEMRALVNKYAAEYDMPASLIHRVIQRESGYNPAARNGPYFGLMQIQPQTAKTMGYRGSPNGLLDAETNVKYAGKYLRGAWLVSRGSHDRAMMWYSKGYYYEAKRLGLLKETGLRG